MKETGGGVWSDASLRESLSEAEEGVSHCLLGPQNKQATVFGGLLSSLPMSRLGNGFNRGWR
jgi:hypothetical protein